MKEEGAGKRPEEFAAAKRTAQRTTSENGTDPLRSIRLMWEPAYAEGRAPRQTRGRKPRLDLRQIVEAAIALADRDGIDGLSMRNVAAALKAGTMSLYTYIGSKAELLEMMVDHVHREVHPVDPNAHWRDQLIELYRQHWSLYHRHPWVLQGNLQRQALGPNVIHVAESLFVILGRIGLDAAGMAHGATLLTNYVHGAARTAILEQQTVAATGVDLEEYYLARMEFWDKYFDVERFPAHTAIWNAGGFDDQSDPFLFGLERILDGLEVLADRTPRSATAGDTGPTAS